MQNIKIGDIVRVNVNIINSKETFGKVISITTYGLKRIFVLKMKCGATTSCYEDFITKVKNFDDSIVCKNKQ